MISREEHAQLRAAIDGFESARKQYDPKRYARGGGYDPKENKEIARMAGLTKEPTNEDRGKVEVYEFVHDPPEKYFSYYDKDLTKITSFMGDKLGDITWKGTPFSGNFGGKRVNIHVRAINGLMYFGTCNLTGGTYCRLKLLKGQKNPLTRAETIEIEHTARRERIMGEQIQSPGSRGYALGRSDGMRHVMKKYGTYAQTNPGKEQAWLAEQFVKGANSGAASSMYIHGARIYSYGPHFPIAKRVGNLIVITTKKPPSKTTGGHIGLIKRAAQAAGKEVIYRELMIEVSGPSGYSNPEIIARGKYLKGGSFERHFPFEGRFDSPAGREALRSAREAMNRESYAGVYDPAIAAVPDYLMKERAARAGRGNPPSGNENQMDRAAREVGLYVETWAPGDGQTRYRFFTKPSSYDEGDGIYTALGRADAMRFINAYRIGRASRGNPMKSHKSHLGSSHDGPRSACPSCGVSDAEYERASGKRLERAEQHPAYEVFVGNIGRVHFGPSREEAEKHFNEYVSQSKSGYGRAAGESVVLMRNGEPVREHFGTQENPLACWRCGKVIKGEVIHHIPTILSERVGADFRKAFHPECYEETEKEAGRELGLKNPPSPRGSAYPLKRILGPIKWEDLSTERRLQIQQQFLYGGMPYNPSGTYWSLNQYPKQVGGMRRWVQSQFYESGKLGTGVSSDGRESLKNPLAVTHAAGHAAPPGQILGDWQRGVVWGTLQYVHSWGAVVIDGQQIMYKASRYWAAGSSSYRDLDAIKKFLGRNVVAGVTGSVGRAFELYGRRSIRLMKATDHPETPEGLAVLSAEFHPKAGPVRENPLLQTILLANPGNPLTRKEAASLLRDARNQVEYAKTAETKPGRSYLRGVADGLAKAVGRFGPRHRGEGIGPVGRIFRRTSAARNPGGAVTIPFKEGQRIPIARARAWVEQYGTQELKKSFREAERLQTRANKRPQFVTWKTLPIGDAKEIEMVTALAHYGDTPDTYYKPPKGSRKGQHLYRHKWGEGGGKHKTAPLLAASGGKALIMPLQGKQVASDWLRH